MAAKLTRPFAVLAPRRPVRKLLDTLSYFVPQLLCLQDVQKSITAFVEIMLDFEVFITPHDYSSGSCIHTVSHRSVRLNRRLNYVG